MDGGRGLAAQVAGHRGQARLPAAGHVDVELPDGGAHRYVLLPEPVKTEYVAVEVLDTQGGTREPALHFAELEAYGPSGEPRAALDLDPAQAVFGFETERWKSRGSDYVPRPSCIEFLDAAGTSKRLVRDDALYGKKGAFVLLDQKTRLHLDLGSLGGVHQPVYRHTEGLGFVVGDIESPALDAFAGIAPSSSRPPMSTNAATTTHSK